MNTPIAELKILCLRALIEEMRIVNSQAECDAHHGDGWRCDYASHISELKQKFDALHKEAMDELESAACAYWKDIAKRMATVLVEVSQAKIFCAESMDIDNYATENVHRAISEYLQAADKEEASV